MVWTYFGDVIDSAFSTDEWPAFVPTTDDRYNAASFTFKIVQDYAVSATGIGHLQYFRDFIFFRIKNIALFRCAAAVSPVVDKWVVKSIVAGEMAVLSHFHQSFLLLLFSD